MATLMKALTIEKNGGRPVLVDRLIPSIRPTYMLVKVAAVALNPADHLCLDFQMSIPGHMMGCDFAGTVVEVGEDVTRDFKPDDRVCGLSRAGEPIRDDVGTFGEYAVVKADVALHIPDFMSFTDAATLGVAVVTTGRCLFDTFNIPYPDPTADGGLSPPVPTPQRQILVYGGSTCMGTMTTQFSKLAGLYVLSTSSPANTEMVRSYGADFVVDHYFQDAPELLTAHATEKTQNGYSPLKFCMDNISQPASAIFCSKVLNPSAQPPALDTPPEWIPTKVDSDIIYSTLTPLTPPLPEIQTVRTIGYSFLGEEWAMMGNTHPASRQDFENSRKFAEITEKLLERTLIRPHPVEVREGGLEGIDEGLKELVGGKVSGKKLVYVVDQQIL